MKAPSPDALAPEYKSLFERCEPLPGREKEVAAIVARIAANRARYQGVADYFPNNGLPWFAIALIHAMEADLDFGCHLHNGDSLEHRTHNVPAGRPVAGNPPFGWSASAADALRYDHWDTVPAERWATPAGLLYELEAYNGWGTRLYHAIPTPYLWAASNLEVPGKYIADGEWSKSAHSEQIGAAVLLKALVAAGAVVFAAEGETRGQGDKETAPAVTPQIAPSPTLPLAPSSAVA